MKHGTAEHPKMYRLAAALAVDPHRHPLAVGVMALLWQYTATYAPQGDIGRWPDEEIARAVGWRGDAALLVRTLIATGWLDDVAACERCRVHRLLIHDWPEHAEDSVHRRLARAGLTFADGTVPNLRRLSERERAQLAEPYQGLPKSCARRAHNVRTKCAPAMPSLAMPEEEDPPRLATLVGPPGAQRAHDVRPDAPRPLRAAAKVARPRVRRLPAAETLTDERRHLATELGLPASRVDLEWSKFRDHEFAAPRSDWTATWRNWLRGAIDRLPRGQQPEPPLDPEREARLQAMNSIIVPRKDRSR